MAGCGLLFVFFFPQQEGIQGLAHPNPLFFLLIMCKIGPILNTLTVTPSFWTSIPWFPPPPPRVNQRDLNWSPRRPSERAIGWAKEEGKLEALVRFFGIAGE